MTEEEVLKPEEGYHKILKLKDPVQYGTELKTFINLRKPRAKNLRKLPIDMEKATMDCMITCAYECSDFDIEQHFDNLSATDTIRVMEVMQGFLDSGQGVKDVDL